MRPNLEASEKGSMSGPCCGPSSLEHRHYSQGTPVQLNNQLTQPEEVKYLGIHLDRKLTWRKNIATNRKQLDLKLRKLYWLNGRKPQLSLENKLLVRKAILKPICTYGVQLWASASNCNIEILERFQSKVLRIITDAPLCVSNAVIKRGLKVLSVRQEVRNCSVTCRQRLDDHPNRLAKSLFQRTHNNRRLERYYPADLATSFYFLMRSITLCYINIGY
jgi:hypothetical protein